MISDRGIRLTLAWLQFVAVLATYVQIAIRSELHGTIRDIFPSLEVGFAIALLIPSSLFLIGIYAKKRAGKLILRIALACDLLPVGLLALLSPEFGLIGLIWVLVYLFLPIRSPYIQRIVLMHVLLVGGFVALGILFGLPFFG